MHKFIRNFLNLLACVYGIAVLCLVPLYITDGYEFIGEVKAELFQMICKISFCTVLPLFIVLFVSEMIEQKTRKQAVRHFLGEKLKRSTMTDRFVAGYGFVVGISYMLSDYRDAALFGYDGWRMGAMTQLMLVMSYFLISRFGKYKRVLLYAGAAGSFFVFSLGILNRFMVDPLGIQADLYASDIVYWEKGNYLSTIGNINWFCGYACSLLFLYLFLFMYCEQKRKINAGLGVYVFAGLAALLLQGSNSGHLTLFFMIFLGVTIACRQANKDAVRAGLICYIMLFGGASLTFLLIHFGAAFNYKDAILRILVNSPIPFIGLGISLGLLILQQSLRRSGDENKKYRMLGQILPAFAIGAFLCIALLIVWKTVNPDSLTFLPKEWFVADKEWGVGRGGDWYAGLACFDSQSLLHKLVGVGPDCMVQAIYSSENLYIRNYLYELHGNMLLTNAHNVGITVLVNTGILGLIMYAGAFLSAMKSLFQQKNVLAKACAFSLLAYQINGFFSFDQPIGLPIVFLVLGLGMGAEREDVKFEIAT